ICFLCIEAHKNLSVKYSSRVILQNVLIPFVTLTMRFYMVNDGMVVNQLITSQQGYSVKMTFHIRIIHSYIDGIPDKRRTWKGAVVIIISAILTLNYFRMIIEITLLIGFLQVIVLQLRVLGHYNLSNRIGKRFCRILFGQKSLDNFGLCVLFQNDQITALIEGLRISSSNVHDMDGFLQNHVRLHLKIEAISSHRCI